MAASKSPRLRLLHIRDEIVALTPHMATVTYEKFAEDYLMIRAAERAILIISEAAKSLPDELLSQEPDIAWRAIRSIGNILRHEYERVEPRVLWSIIQDELPKLNLAILRLLNSTI